MIHFAYPNIRSTKEFIGCGRFVVANDLPGKAYHTADPDSPNITEIRTVAENMVPDIISATRNIFEKRDNPSFQYRGDSLDLAYLLAYINTAWPLKDINLAERNTDIWCTGAIDIKDRQYSWLKTMDSQQFALKLEAFISQKNLDKIFIIPNANISHHKKKLKSIGVAVLSIGEINNFNLPIDCKVTLAIGPNDVPELVEYLFKVPDNATFIHNLKKINRHASFNRKESYINGNQYSASKGLEGFIDQDISQVTLDQIVSMLKLSESGLKEDLENAETYYARGYSYHQKEEYKHAIVDYDKAIEMDPNYAEAYQKRGICYRIIGNYEQALADYAKAIKIQRGWFHNARAIVLLETNKYDKALTAINRSIRINPDYYKAYNTRGVIQKKQENFENAIADYTKAIEMDPNYKVAYLNRGICNCYLDKHENAIADYNKAIEMDPNYKKAYYNRGICYMQLGEYENAIVDYQKAIELDPAHIQAINNLVWILSTCPSKEYRNGPMALKYARQATELIADIKPSRALFNLHDSMAAAYAETGYFVEAIATQEKAIALLEEAEDIKNQEEMAQFKERLVLYQAHKPYRIRDE